MTVDYIGLHNIAFYTIKLLLNTMSEQQQHTNSELLKVEEVAELLHQSTATIQRWRRTGRLNGFFRIGRRWLIKKSDLDNFINQKLLTP